MKFERKDILYFTPVIATFVFTFVLSLPAVLLGSDLLFQLRLSQDLFSLNIQKWISDALQINSIIYPPLFQVLLFPVFIFGLGYVSFLQVFFLPCAILSLELLFYLRGHKVGAVFIGLLALSSFAFVDRSLQVIPIALDFILLPLTIYTALEKKNKSFIGLSSIILYNHGIMGVSVLGGLFLYKLFKREWKPILWIFLISLPIIVFSVPYIIPALHNFTGKINTQQQRDFLANPVLFTWEYMGQSLLFGFPIILLGYVVIVYKGLKRHLDNLDKVSILTLGSMLFTTLFQQDRFLQYSTIPLAILFTNFVSQSQHRTFWFILTLGLAIFFYIILWIWLSIGAFDTSLGYHVG